MFDATDVDRYLPDWRMSDDSLVELIYLSERLPNPSCILETGIGLSTFLMRRFWLKDDTHFVIEDGLEHIHQHLNHCVAAGITPANTFCCPYLEHGYDLSPVPEPPRPFDLILIDGPGCGVQRGDAGLMGYIRKHTTDRTVFVLDDVNDANVDRLRGEFLSWYPQLACREIRDQRYPWRITAFLEARL